MRVLIAALLVTTVAASGCANSCSGHGQCLASDTCKCEPRWVGNDCSKRQCAFGLSWVTSTDTSTAPAGAVGTSEGIGGRHLYAECSDKGKCDEGTGECVCFDGYEGKGCRRQSCPNACSGHGRCVYNQKLNPNYQAQGKGINTKNPYNPSHYIEFDSQYWDKQKTRSCVCDRGFEGTDCSQRSCPKGDDPLTECELAAKQHAPDVQRISFQAHTSVFSRAVTNEPGFFTLTFTDMFGANYTTRPIKVTGATTELDNAGSLDLTAAAVFAADVEEALESLPNFAIPNVTVTATADPDSAEQIQFLVTFVDSANAGLQGLLECSYASTVDKTISNVDSENAYNFGAAQPRFFSPYSSAASSSPRICEATHTDTTLGKVQAKEIQESAECSNRGTCDYGSGLCTCFSGFSGEACSEQTIFF